MLLKFLEISFKIFIKIMTSFTKFQKSCRMFPKIFLAFLFKILIFFSLVGCSTPQIQIQFFFFFCNYVYEPKVRPVCPIFLQSLRSLSILELDRVFLVSSPAAWSSARQRHLRNSFLNNVNMLPASWWYKFQLGCS